MKEIPDSTLKQTVFKQRVHAEGAHIRVHQPSAKPDAHSCTVLTLSFLKHTESPLPLLHPPSLVRSCSHHKVWQIKCEPILSLKSIKSSFNPNHLRDFFHRDAGLDHQIRKILSRKPFLLVCAV